MILLLSILFPLLAQVQAAPVPQDVQVQVAPAPPQDHTSAIFAGIVAVLGAVGTIMVHANGKRAGRAETVEIKGQPLRVALEHEFVTRREFDELKGSFGAVVVKMEGLFTQTMQAIDMRDEAMVKKVERLGERTSKDLRESNSSHQEARGRIHSKVNNQGELLAALAAKVSVGEDIKALAEAIITEIRGEKEDGK